MRTETLEGSMGHSEGWREQTAQGHTTRGVGGLTAPIPSPAPTCRPGSAGKQGAKPARSTLSFINKQGQICMI